MLVTWKQHQEERAELEKLRRLVVLSGLSLPVSTVAPKVVERRCKRGHLSVIGKTCAACKRLWNDKYNRRRGMLPRVVAISSGRYKTAQRERRFREIGAKVDSIMEVA